MDSGVLKHPRIAEVVETLVAAGGGCLTYDVGGGCQETLLAVGARLAVKHGRTEAAGAHAARAGATARRCGNPVVLAGAGPRGRDAAAPHRPGLDAYTRRTARK